MVDERTIWVGRDGQRFGPYDEATLRAWIAEGKVAAHSLGWREGMAEWRPLSEILGIVVPPPMAGVMGPTLHGELPPPPDIHWVVIFLVDLFVGGLMGLVWQFMQASWIKKIDPASKATTWLVVSLCMLPVVWFVMMGMVFNQADGAAVQIAKTMSLVGLVFLIVIASLVFRYMAYFSMARSMREKLPAYGLVPSIGGVTLFFFTTYYLQGQMTWVARWRQTGQVTPPAPKGVFWIIVAIWFGLAFLFALLVGLAALGSYQH
jgi:hypothetical protein